MPYEIKDNTFTMFTNDNKTKENQPDYTGQGKFLGKEVKIAGWKKVSAAGKGYVSYKVEEKDSPFIKTKEKENTPF
tara:strand:- start:181 stop:408 length:228 start_codon:yes stop_codon:yes gene_type:complete